MPLVRKKQTPVDPHWDYVYSVTREFMDDWSNAFVASTDELKAGVGAAMYAQAVETGQPSLVIGSLPFDTAAAAQTVGWTPLIESVYARAGKAEVGRLNLSFNFLLNNPYALQWIPQHAAQLVSQVEDETKAAIRGAILDGYQFGTPPARTGMRIREMVGLTERDSRAVMNYWRALTPEADLDARRVDDLADSYARRLLRRRAENIARTETITAAARGTQDSWATARDAGLVAPESQQVWIAATESGRTCPICMALDGQKAKLGAAFPGGFSGPPAHPSCLPGDALVLARDGIAGASKRWFDGDVIVFQTTSGRKLTCTPNHPILTPSGWVAARFVNVGGDVVCDGGGEWEAPLFNGDGQNVPARIHDVTEAFFGSGQVTARPVPIAPEHFHGDGKGSKVAVVGAYGLLGRPRNVAFAQPFSQLLFVLGHALNGVLFNGLGHFNVSRPRTFGAANGGVSLCHLTHALFSRHLCPFRGFRFALAPDMYAALNEAPADNVAINPKVTSDGVLRHPASIQLDNTLNRKRMATRPPFDTRLSQAIKHDDLSDSELARYIASGAAGPVFTDKVVNVDVQSFSGHVYNLQTPSNFYLANGIVTHNCRCAIGLVTEIPD